MAVYKLSKEMEIGGEMKKEIEYDLDSLTGMDVAKAIRDLANQNIIVTMTETDQNYHAAIFAAASGLMLEEVQKFPLKDFVAVCNKVRNFFLSESE